MTKFTKQVIAVIIVSVLAGGIITLLPSHLSLISAQPKALHEVPAFAPTPTPVPMVINQDSHLSQEISKLDPEDFSGDYKSLKTTASSI